MNDCAPPVHGANLVVGNELRELGKRARLANDVERAVILSAEEIVFHHAVHTERARSGRR